MCSSSDIYPPHLARSLTAGARAAGRLRGVKPAVRDFVAGMRLFGEGWTVMARNKRLWLLGMVPAFIAMVLMVGVIVLLAVWVVDLVTWSTPFADDWSANGRDTLRGVLAADVRTGVARFDPARRHLGGLHGAAVLSRVRARDRADRDPGDRGLCGRLDPHVGAGRRTVPSARAAAGGPAAGVADA